MENSLAVRSSVIKTFDDIKNVAHVMVQSGYFQDSRDVAQAIVKILAGRELGLGEFASMTGIHVIKGKPALGANLIASMIKNDPRYDYRVTEISDAACSVKFYEGGQEIGTSTFTADDAKKSGTQNMNKFPRNMLFARAISNGAKWYTPGIFGGAPVYTPDELGADVDEDGEIISAEFKAIEPQPPVNDPAWTWTVKTAAALKTSNGSLFGDLNKDQLTVIASGKYPGASGEQESAAKYLIERLEMPIDFDPVNWLIQRGHCENTFSATALLNKHVPDEIKNSPEALDTWGRIYRAWKDAGAETVAAAQNTTNGIELE